jgi:hypothetical protein
LGRKNDQAKAVNFLYTILNGDACHGNFLSEGKRLALTRLKAGVNLVDNVKTAPAGDDTTSFVTLSKGLNGI